MTIPVWMQASWFKKQGYRGVDRRGISELLWKPFADDADPPRWLPGSDKLPERTPGKVNITAFSSGWCLAQNLVYERAKRAAAEFGDTVEFTEIDTSTREAVAEWGRSDEVLVDGKKLQKGPPPSYKQGPQGYRQASQTKETLSKRRFRQSARQATTSISTSMLSLDSEAGIMNVLAGGSLTRPGACSCQYSHSVARMSS